MNERSELGARQPAVPQVRMFTALSPASRNWPALLGMAGLVIALHVIGWGTLLGIVEPAGYRLGTSQIFGLGLGVTAYTLGLRHAFDADHIAAIDTTTRKLISDSQRPTSVGFWFSLGHSSVVFGLCAMLAFGVRSLAPQIEDGGSVLQQTTGVIGASVSGAFLLFLGIVNLLMLLHTVRAFRKFRSGRLRQDELERHLDGRGVINRVLRPLTKAVRRPRQMYLIGLLFGLGFDTATEISLLVLAGGAAVVTIPWYAILTLPVLFAAGMCALDTLDGVLMTFTYGWAFANPGRKLYYNITITALSVAIAFIIGGQEIVAVVASKLDVTDGPMGWISAVDLDYAGFVIIALFIACWAAAIAISHFGKLNARSKEVSSG